MDKTTLKALICDDSTEFGVNLASYLSQYNIYAYTRKNEENIIINSIIKDTPDLVITNLTLKNSDAIELMIKVRSISHKIPQFIIISEIHNSYIERQLIECGASYTLSRPFENKEIYDIIKLAAIKHLSDDCDDAELIVTNLIRSIGIPAHIKGYRYIRTAILECAQNYNYLEHMTKELYPHVAEIYQTTPERVERAIRHAIEMAWNKNDREAMSEFFGCNAKNLISRPTNSEFIALASDKLIMHMKRVNSGYRHFLNYDKNHNNVSPKQSIF